MTARADGSASSQIDPKVTFRSYWLGFPAFQDFSPQREPTHIVWIIWDPRRPQAWETWIDIPARPLGDVTNSSQLLQHSLPALADALAPQLAGRLRR